MSKSTRAIWSAGLAVLSWSTVATAFKIALINLHLIEMLWLAACTALVFYTIVLTVRHKWPIIKNLSLRDWTSFAFIGLLNPVAYYLILFKAYDLLPAQVAQPINYVWPVLLIILMAVIFKKPISKDKYVGMIVSLLGVVCISFGSKSIFGEISFIGLFCALFSAFLWACYWIINSQMKRIDGSVILFLGFLFGSIYLSGGVMLAGDISHLSTTGLLSGMYVGIFEMGMPFLCFEYAIRNTRNEVLVNQMCYLAPFFSLFFIHLVLGEPIVFATYLGLTLIVSGLLYNNR
jgi:drug/metabolite transporter (DMT)-like permease